MNFPKMDTELKSKWLEALRSGDYAQSRLLLRDERGYCCLGVLCDIVAPDRWQYSTTLGKYYHGEYGRTALPGYEVQQISQLTEDTMDKLTQMNDVQNLSFVSIAEWIEENL